MRCVLILLPYVLWGNAVLAQDADEESALASLYGDAEMVSIATGTEKAITKAPAVASVISAQDILDSGARSIDEVLEGIPGLHVARSGLSRLDPLYSIRGILTGYTQQTLVLLNGVRFSVLSTGGRPPTFRLPVSAIERIEIIRGPGSAVHGADAFSGVINIITKDSSLANSTTVAARYGAFDSRDFLVQTGATFDDWLLGVSVESQKSDGDKERIIQSDLQSTLDALIGTDVSHAPGHLQTHYDVLNSHLSLTNTAWTFHYWRWQQRNAGQGQGGAQAIDVEGNVDVTQDLFNVQYNTQIFNDMSMGVRYSFEKAKYSTLFQLFPDGAVLPIGADGNINFFAPNGIVFFSDGVMGNPGATEETHFIEAQLEFQQFDAHRIRFAAGGRQEKSRPTEFKNFGPGVIDGTEGLVDGVLTDVSGTINAYQPDATRYVRYASLQDEIQLGRDWEFTAGIRHDRYDDFGSTTNPRAAMVWAANNDTTVKLLYGRAFRAPSFAELYYINNPVSLGNTSLGPERISTKELSIDYQQSERMHWVFSVFDYTAVDLIEFVPDIPGDPSSTSTAQNARTQHGRGGEVDWQWKLSEIFSFEGNYSYQNATDEKLGTHIADVPGKQIYLAAHTNMSNTWRFTTQLNHIADRRRVAGDARKQIADYTLLDISMRGKNVFDHVDVAFTIRNALDDDARSPSNGVIADDYPLESRSVWLELTYRITN